MIATGPEIAAEQTTPGAVSRMLADLERKTP